MDFYDSNFIERLKKQLALSGFSLRKSRQLNKYYIYSRSKDRYELLCPYQQYYLLFPFDSQVSPYQKAIDTNLIKSHIKHCLNVAKT